MEQHNNMMAMGMAGGQNNMPNRNSMQRPQPGNIEQQIFANIIQKMREQNVAIPAGWQTTFDPKQRATHIIQLVTSLRMLSNGTDITRCIDTAVNFELKTLREAPTKDMYTQAMTQKLRDITARRVEQVQNMPNGQPGMNMNMNNMLPQGNPNMMQNGMVMNMNMGMNMPNGGMGMPNGQMGGQPNPNMNFPAQLQRQMQASPLPPQQQPTTLDPAALQNPQMPNQMLNMNQINPAQQQQFNANQGGQTRPPNFDQNVDMVARKQIALLNPHKKAELIAQFMGNLSEQQRAAFAGREADILLTPFRHKARQAYIQSMNQGSQQNGGVQMNNQMDMSSNNLQQPQGQQSGANFDFASFLGQQANAIKSQESGGEVVPASNHTNNNNNGNSAQMNVPQGVNPQLLANQNGQPGNNPYLQRQFMEMQQEKTRREQMQMQANQHALAQQQIHNQNQLQLRGQPGGINAPNALNGGQVNSPAMNMNMLNRPMVPPGQTTPSTPSQQQNRPQGVPQTPMNAANQLAQHHKNMLSQNGQHMVQGNQNGAQQGGPNQIPPEIQEKLRTMNPDQVRAFLARPNPGMNLQNMNPQMQGQKPAMPGMTSDMNAVVPGFNVQPPPNQQQQQPQQPPNPQQQAMLRQRMQSQQQQQQNALKQRAMDMRTYPKHALATLSVAVPDDATTWGALKAHVHRNHAVLPPDMLNKVSALQMQYFQANPQEITLAMQALKTHLQNSRTAQQQQSTAQPSQPAMTMPPGQAPTAPMVAPPGAGLMQTHPNMGAPNANQPMPRIPPGQITQQDIQMFRTKVPGAQNLTDNQIIHAMMTHKAKVNQSAAQNNPNMVQQPGQPKGVQQPGNVAPGNQQQQQPQQQQPTQNQPPNQGQKRPQPSADDVMEIPNPNIASQAPAMQPSQSQQQGLFNVVSRDEFNRMNPEQQANFKAQMEQSKHANMLKAQSMHGNQNATPAQQPAPRTAGQLALFAPPTDAERERLRSMHAEISLAYPKQGAVQIDGQSLEQAQASLRKLWPAVANLDRFWYIAMRTGFPEPRMRELVRAKIVVQQNAMEGGHIKDFLAVPVDTLKKIERLVGSFFAEMKTVQTRAHGQSQQQQPQAQPQTQAPTAPATQAQQPRQPPAKAAQPQPPAKPERKPSQVGARKPSQSTKAPPAPTTDDKKFDWATPSPHAVPEYGARKEVTQKDLKIPPSKKPKTGKEDSSGSTPAGPATGTPSTSGASPSISTAQAQAAEQAKKLQQAQLQQKQVQRPKPNFVCDDVFCWASVDGFETEDMLKKHKEADHSPVADPMDFFLENAANYLGVNKETGEALPAKKDSKVAPPQARPRPVAAQGGVKKDGLTPSTQQGATPATPASVGKIGLAGKTDANSAAATVEADKDKPKTLMETMADKVGFKMPAGKVTKAPSGPEISLDLSDSDDSWIDVFKTESTDDITFRDWTWLGDPDQMDFALCGLDYSPEPTPTPESVNSSQESELERWERIERNFAWDAFGDGDTGVPEFVVNRTRELRLAANNSKGEDAEMVDADRVAKEKEKAAGEGMNESVLENWEEDVIDWAAFTGGDDKLFDAAAAF